MKELLDKIENLEIDRARKAAELEKLEERLDSLYDELTAKQIEEEAKIFNFLRRVNTGALEFELENPFGGKFVVYNYKLHREGERWKIEFESSDFCDKPGKYDVYLSSLKNLKIVYE